MLEVARSPVREDWSALGRKKKFDYRALIAGPPPHDYKSDKRLRQMFPVWEIDYVINNTDAQKPTLDAIKQVFLTNANSPA